MKKSELISKLKSEGFSNKIIKAFKLVPREKFISEELEDSAYLDQALPLEQGATISQPYTIAFMLQLLALKKNQKILEIGSGSGYVLALLKEITDGKIYGVEIISSLTEKSRKHLKDLNYKNVKVYNKNGFNGLKEKAPFDRILVSASCEEIPQHLPEQLKKKGILVCPVRRSIYQIKKLNKKYEINEFPGFIFVPLISD